MIFHSTYEENLKKLSKEHEIGYVSIGENYDSFDFDKITKKAYEFAAKHKIDNSKVKCRRYNNVEIDEYGHTEDRLIFYYEAPETDVEYNKRIEELKVKDLKDSIQEIVRFNGCIRQKKELGELYLELVVKGKYKGLRNEVFEEFISDESIEEKVQKAYKNGYNAGKKESDELKKKLKDLT